MAVEVVFAPARQELAGSPGALDAETTAAPISDSISAGQRHRSQARPSR